MLLLNCLCPCSIVRPFEGLIFFMKNSLLATQIIRMKSMDQELRFLTRDIGTTDGLANSLVYVMDLVHGIAIHRIIDQYGYPTSCMVGKKALEDFWLLVQHQDDDLDLQKNCLEHCDFAPKEYALLFDRVSVNLGKKQYYGTQYGAPIDDEEGVDLRRKEFGLEPISEYHARMRKMFPKGPPRTYHVDKKGRVRANK